MGERRSLLLVDVGADPMEAISLRLRQMGIHVVRTKAAEHAVEALADPRYAVGAVVVPPDLPALDLERAIAAFRGHQRLASLRGEDSPEERPILVHGRRPDADARARLRRAGATLALWQPLDDHLLRFQVNCALAGGPPAVATRRALRVPAHWPVAVRAGGREKPAKIYSLSCRGAYLATGRPSMVRSLVHLELPLPGGDLRLVGEVVMTNVPGNLVRANLPIGMGIRFTGHSGEDERSIAYYAQQRADWLHV